MQIEYRTDIGNRRTTNEDSLCVTYNVLGHTMLLIADGMGGHNAGEVASKIACDTLKEKFQEYDGEAGYKEFLETAITEANNRIYESSLINTEYSKMGTTLSVAIDDGKHVFIGHVGDSRIYYADERGLSQITKDHTIVQALYEDGEITADEMITHPYRNILMQSLGTNKNIVIDRLELKVPDKGYLLLCSDGLTEEVSDHLIYKTLIQKGKNVDEKTEELLDLALNNEGKDNVSLIVMERSQNG